MARSEAQLERTFARSLGNMQGLIPDVGEMIDEMVEAGMITYQGEREGTTEVRLLKATRLGHVAVRHFLLPATVALFRRVLLERVDASFFDLLLLAAASEDCMPVLPVDFEELDALAETLGRERSHLLQERLSELSRLFGIGGKRLLAALKMAVLVRAWTRLGDVEVVSREWGCYPFEVGQLCESVTRLLLAMEAVVPVEVEEGVAERVEGVPVHERIAALRKMVESGLDEEAITLTLIEGVGPTLARRLWEAGLVDVEELAMALVEEVKAIRGVSGKRAMLWLQQANELLESRSAFRYREEAPMVVLRPTGWPEEVDPYRLRRAIDLEVRGGEGGLYLVRGGLDPHRVVTREGKMHCDCADAAKSQLCKHQLAVRLRRGDKGLRRLVKVLATDAEDIDLLGLWMAR